MPDTGARRRRDRRAQGRQGEVERRSGPRAEMRSTGARKAGEAEAQIERCSCRRAPASACASISPGTRVSLDLPHDRAKPGPSEAQLEAVDAEKLPDANDGSTAPHPELHERFAGQRWAGEGADTVNASRPTVAARRRPPGPAPQGTARPPARLRVRLSGHHRIASAARAASWSVTDPRQAARGGSPSRAAGHRR